MPPTGQTLRIAGAVRRLLADGTKKTRGRSRPAAGRARRGGGGWTFLTNHTHVLLCLAREPQARMREVAAVVGITERAVQRIVAELEEAGYLQKSRLGRRNQYAIRTDLPLRHPLEQHQPLSSLIEMVLGGVASGGNARGQGSPDTGQ